MNETPNHDLRLQRLIERVLIADDIQTGSAADLEARLDAADNEPITDLDVDRILAATHERIAETRPVYRDRRNGVLSTQYSVLGPPHSATLRRPDWAFAAVVASVACVVAALILDVRPRPTAVVQTVDQSRPTTIASERIARAAANPPPAWTRLTARERLPAPATERITVGSTLATSARERRRVTLPDGSVLYVNDRSRVVVESPRRLRLLAGEVFVEVVPTELLTSPVREAFTVTTPDRRVTALGTKFAVSTRDAATGVVVAQGKVQVSGVEQLVEAGQSLAVGSQVERLPAVRESESLAWTHDLMVAAEAPLLPGNPFRGGALMTRDASGRESRLSLRKLHIDVHIEDGFARTTIDQTYFNHDHSRLEGTFYFPLPPDASLSRLAMYVGENLMEGGMVEREYARNVYEQIVYTKRDPALLEWVDGSTFKMRVFPIEGRQEKRVLLSYTQRLPTAYGRTSYRFPAGHNLTVEREWSAHVRVKGGADARWSSPSHDLAAKREGGDLVLDTSSLSPLGERAGVRGPSNAAPPTREPVSETQRPLTPNPSPPKGRGESERDLVLELSNAQSDHNAARLSSFVQEGYRYLMLRFAPDLAGKMSRPRRHWVVLFESSGDRDPVLARTQIEIARTLLQNAEHDDTFSVVTAGTQAATFKSEPLPCSQPNIDAAVRHLEQTHLVGALDLAVALEACTKSVPDAKATEKVILHLGSGIAALGERDEAKLAERLPRDVTYVGVGVGKRWSRSFMKLAAARTGGYFTQINPDEKVSWRAFELLATLNAPRLLDVKVNDERERLTFLNHTDSLAQGEELCAVTRLRDDETLPNSLSISGRLDGKLFERRVAVENVIERVGHLPRTWARLEIDRLLADGADQHKADILALSKAMYVMSPFTSLLVLESDEMYAQFKVDRGRKDHWAMYPAPAKIPVVYEPFPAPPTVPAVTWRQAEADVQRQAVNQRLWTLAGIAPGIRRLTELDRNGNGIWFDDAIEIERLSEARVPTDNYMRNLFGRSVDNGSRPIVPFFYQRHQANSDWFGVELLGTRVYPVGDLIVPASPPTTWETYSNGFSLMVTPRIIIQEEELMELGDNSNRFTDVNSKFLSYRNRYDVGRAVPWRTRNWGLVDSRAQPLLMSTDDGINVDFSIPRLQLAEPNLHALRVLSAADPLFKRRAFVIPSANAPLVNLDGLMPFQASYDFVTQGLDRYVGNDFDGDLSRRDKFLEVLRQVELAHIDFTDQPPIMYPTREEWEKLVNRRSKLLSEDRLEQLQELELGLERQVRGLRRGERVAAQAGRPVSAILQRLLAAFDEATELDLNDTPLRDAIARLAERHGIAIRLDEAALVDAGVQLEQPLTLRRSGVSLLSAIEALLAPLHLVTLIRDDELVVTTPAKAWELIQFDAVEASATSLLRRIQAGIKRPAPVVAIPRFSDFSRELSDLTLYAPGLQTSRADLLAVLEAEVPALPKPAVGSIDPAARALIDRCRSRGWESVGWVEERDPPRPTSHQPPVGLAPRPTLQIDGAGRFVIERTLALGLRERIVCDGQSLWHLYPELGLAAKRLVSRFHRAELSASRPWLVPAAEDLAAGADVRRVDANTIEIVQHAAPLARLEKGVGGEERSGRDIAPSPVTFGSVTPALSPKVERGHSRLQLVFAPDGRLAERRVVDTDGRVRWRMTIAVDGNVKLIDRDGQNVAAAKWSREACDPPSLTPDTRELVVLPMPARASQHVASSSAFRIDLQFANVDFTHLPEADVMSLLAGFVAERNADRVRQLVGQRFFDRGDRRVGFYTLLLASGTSQLAGHELPIGNGKTARFAALADHPSSPLAQYLDQHVRQLTPPQATRFEPVAGDGFVRRLSEFRSLVAEWTSGRTGHEPPANVSAAVDRVLAVADDLPNRMAWELLHLVKAKVTSQSDVHRIAESLVRFEADSRLVLAARVTRVRWLQHAGDVAASRELLRDWFVNASEAGAAPVLDKELRETVRMTVEGAETWSRLVRDAHTKLITGGHMAAALRLAMDCHSVGDRELAEELRGAVMARMASMQSQERSPLTPGPSPPSRARRDDIPIAEACWHFDRSGESAVWLDRLLGDGNFARSAAAWRLAATLAEQGADFRRAVDSRERAIALEIERGGDQINLTALRAEFEKLFATYRTWAEQGISDAVDRTAVADRVRIAADQWRRIDGDAASACALAARVLHKLSEPDAAWNYLTTPIASKPGDSTSWLAVARVEAEFREIDRADRAFATAFSLEPTNPDILFEHAEFLGTRGRVAERRDLLRRIAHGDWQPRFAATQQKARDALAATP